MSNWWSHAKPPNYISHWWAVEHEGHPAFFLRSLMPGDFGPNGAGPLPRHTYDLDGRQLEEFPVKCCTCGVVPPPESLVPIERCTGDRGRELFFARYVFKVKPWPPSTDHRTCWNCCDPTVRPSNVVDGRIVCTPCMNHHKRFARATV